MPNRKIMQNTITKKASNTPRKSFCAAIVATAIMLLFSYSADAAEPNKQMLIPGGMTFGAKLSYPLIMIAEVSDEADCPARLAGLCAGDCIISLNGEEVCSPEHLSELIKRSNGSAIAVKYRRSGKEYTATMIPKHEGSEYRLGITVRNSSAGIGTVTFITEDGLFGGLGHGICCKESGELAPMQYGTVCEVEIKGIKKGTSGAPGEIRGAFRSLHTGRISANTKAGVFGLYAEMPTCAIYGPTEVAAPSELVIGKAKIISTLGDDGPREYEIEITSIFEPRAVNEKGFAIKVTDPALIERTGGIIQGMSGSPILQNGKLVGAVTHVMVNEPTMGYGIFIESMLKAAG